MIDDVVSFVSCGRIVNYKVNEVEIYFDRFNIFNVWIMESTDWLYGLLCMNDEFIKNNKRFVLLFYINVNWIHTKQQTFCLLFYINVEFIQNNKCFVCCFISMLNSYKTTNVLFAVLYQCWIHTKQRFVCCFISMLNSYKTTNVLFAVLYHCWIHTKQTFCINVEIIQNNNLLWFDYLALYYVSVSLHYAVNLQPLMELIKIYIKGSSSSPESMITTFINWSNLLLIEILQDVLQWCSLGQDPPANVMAICHGYNYVMAIFNLHILYVFLLTSCLLLLLLLQVPLGQSQIVRGGYWLPPTSIVAGWEYVLPLQAWMYCIVCLVVVLVDNDELKYLFKSAISPCKYA